MVWTRTITTRLGRPATKIQSMVRGVRARRAYRTMRALSRVGAKRALIARAYTGGALAATALAGYGAYRGVKRIRAAKARARKRRTIAYPIKRLKCKHRITYELDTTGQNTRTLYANRITDISKGGTADQREYDVVNIKGFRLNMHFRNLRTEAPIRLSVAIVANKSASETTPNVTEFFRGYGDDRSEDFANTRNFTELMNTPINTDKYTVLHRWNFNMGPYVLQTDSTARPTGRKSQVSLQRWIPFKRQFRYDNTGVAPEAGTLYLIWWADREFNTAGTLAQGNSIESQIRVITFFNDATR